MKVVGPKPAAFRHVVFPDLARGGPPVNFASADDSPPEANLSPVIESEEHGFLTAIFEAGGLDVNDYKVETLRRRVPSCLRALRVGTLREARELLQRHPAMVKVAISAMVIGVTGFFRDPSVFAALEQRTLRELTSRGSTARIWSVGCSEGAELYSIAMLLANLGVLHRCHLLGTDCRVDAIKRSADGVFDAQAVTAIPPVMKQQYLAPDGEGWKINSWLRTTVQWRAANVLNINEPGAWDMILCRNMAIYLGARAAAKLWQTLYTSLRPGGFLVLGKAERPMGASGFSLAGPCIYRRNRS